MWNWGSGANVGSTLSGMLAPSAFFIGLAAFFAALFSHFHQKHPKWAKIYAALAWLSFISAIALFFVVPDLIVKIMADKEPPAIVQQLITPQPAVPPPSAKPAQTAIPIEKFVSVTAPEAGGDQTHYLDQQAASYLSSLLKNDGFQVVDSESDAPIHIEILDVTANATPSGAPGSICPDNHSEQAGTADLQISVADNSGNSLLSQSDFSGSGTSCMNDLNAEELGAEQSAWQNAVSNAKVEIEKLLAPNSASTTP